MKNLPKLKMIFYKTIEEKKGELYKWMLENVTKKFVGKVHKATREKRKQITRRMDQK
jgi:hypothetical protein